MALQPGMILVLNARNLLVLAVLVRLVDQHMPDLGALGPASRRNDLSQGTGFEGRIARTPRHPGCADGGGEPPDCRRALVVRPGARLRPAAP